MIDRNPNLIYDVGLHRGEDTHYYLKNGFNVIAFEADPDLIQANKKRFAKSISEGRLVIVDGAIVDDPSEKKVRFFKNLDESEWGTMDTTRVRRNEILGTRHAEIVVNSVDFNKCLKKYGIPYYMKIDIECADVTCLRALKDSDIKPRYLSIESERNSFQKLIHEFELLSELGYTEFKAVQQAVIHPLKWPKKSREGIHIAHRFPHGSSGPFGKDLDNWMCKEDILKEYEIIFQRYQKYGEETIWEKNKLAKSAMYLFSIFTGWPIPGWYDTHAKLPE